MRSARLGQPGAMRVEDRPLPVPGQNDVLVRVEAAGICGSDRHMFRGEYPTALPVTLGHEFCGIVEAAGSAVSQVRAGERITADPNIGCGYCPACRAGRVNLCERLQAIGVTRDGGFAEYVVIPETQAIALPADLDPLHGAFSEPLACCLHGLDVAAIRPGDSVAVLGGLFFTLVGSHDDAATVTKAFSITLLAIAACHVAGALLAAGLGQPRHRTAGQEVAIVAE